MLRLLYWQGPTLLNPHFATGQKDQEGSRPFYEPLIYFDGDALPVPVLAAEVPTRENGGIAKDGRSTTWKLKRGVTWHDGKPFGADDVVFNWQYATDPDAAAYTAGAYEGIKGVEKARQPHGARGVQGTHAAVGAGRRVAADPEAPVRELPRQQVARGANQPEAGRYRSLSLRRFQAGRPGQGRTEPDLPPAPPAALRRHRDQGRAATPSARHVPCCRPASSTTPGTCWSRTRCSSAWKAVARAAWWWPRAAPPSTCSSTPPTPGPRSTVNAPTASRATRCCPRRHCARRCCW